MRIHQQKLNQIAQSGIPNTFAKSNTKPSEAKNVEKNLKKFKEDRKRTQYF